MKTEAQAYIINFFSDIKQLTDYLADYSNVLLVMRIRLKIQKNEEITGIDLIEKVKTAQIEPEYIQRINESAAQVRYWTTQVYIKFMGLSKKITEIQKAEPTFKALYKEIQISPVPQFETVEQFVILSHELFSTTALGDLLIKSQDYMDKLSGINEPINQ